MSYQITLDAGTTNTRAILWKNGEELLARRKSETGVSCTAVDGNNHRLQQAVKECVNGLLMESGLLPKDVECILASGMITSDVGLYVHPHLTAPVGIADLANGIKRVSLPEISSIPFWFIPGMKNRVDQITTENFEAMDIMRGEEVEAVALLQELPAGAAYLLVLPGSHTKFVAAENGTLTGCLTTLSGELLSVISKQTILAETVGRHFAQKDTYRRDMVELGYRTARQNGLARAAFSARILKQQAGYSPEEMASYLLGAVLEQDVRALRNSKAISVTRDTHIVISGKDILCRGFFDVMRADGGFQHVSMMSAEREIPLSAKGALAVYFLQRR